MSVRERSCETADTQAGHKNQIENNPSVPFAVFLLRAFISQISSFLTQHQALPVCTPPAKPLILSKGSFLHGVFTLHG